MVKIKRVYDLPCPADGVRILVDRLWPRGLSKAKAKVVLWLREIAPSHSLRKWFGHDPSRWAEFQRRYRKELAKKNNLIVEIRRAEKAEGTVTLLFAARDEKHNNAVALGKVLAGRAR